MKVIDYLKDYNKKNIYPFHMPGNKRQGEFNQLDFTEVEGLDNLYHPEGIYKESLDRIKNLYGTKESYILVNGSTVGILSAITGCAKKGDNILMARNCHKSVYNAVEIWDLSPTYLMPKSVHSFMGEVLSSDVEDALNSNSKITVCIITSPTYEGIVSDIKSIAEICHNHNVTLIVDEAHGSHLMFDDYFPNSATELGADVVIQSTHKTLTSLTGTGLLHICSNRVNKDIIKKRLMTFQTSSPNYLMVASVDRCICEIIEKGKELFSAYRKRINNFYLECGKLKNLSIYKGENAFAFDKSKIVILTQNTDLSSTELQKILREKYIIETEMASADYIIAMTSIYDTDEGFSRLINALKDIDKNCIYIEKRNITLNHIPKIKIKPCKVEDMKKEFIDIENCCGKVSGEYIYAYPPGIPIIFIGEVFDEKAVNTIKYLIEKGVNVVSEGNKLPFKVCCAIDTR